MCFSRYIAHTKCPPMGMDIVQFFVHQCSCWQVVKARAHFSMWLQVSLMLLLCMYSHLWSAAHHHALDGPSSRPKLATASQSSTSQDYVQQHNNHRLVSITASISYASAMPRCSNKDDGTNALWSHLTKLCTCQVSPKSITNQGRFIRRSQCGGFAISATSSSQHCGANMRNQ